MAKEQDRGRRPSPAEVREAERVRGLPPEQRRAHPSAVPADATKLDHVHTYGELPAYYLDLPFVCRRCGATEIWKARDQKWYYEEAKGHVDATAVHCHACRTAAKRPRTGEEEA
jgi:hypothetical protein